MREMSSDRRDLELMRQALGREAEGQRALLSGDAETARQAFTDASSIYRESWDSAPPWSFGRLVGMLKAAIISGSYADAAAFVRNELSKAPEESATASYALAVADLALGDDAGARVRCERMRGFSEPLDRAADALVALAAADPGGYARALRAIVVDFEHRTDHLTGVPIADTALMLERLAQTRGITTDVESALLPRI